MNKIALITITTLMLGAAQAEYIIKQPLEQAQGGSLPSRSIIFNNDKNKVEPNNKECHYIANSYLWREQTDGQLVFFRWDGELYAKTSDLAFDPPEAYTRISTSTPVHRGLIYDGKIEFEGNRYSKGELKVAPYVYEICIESI
ncbi:hypothetical protein [Pseudomonas aeruginosa]|uniref:hypothetical protein n=1 Tax=Pseudomonas aeruginosa TaxID=287 RepID=UPI00406BED8F